MSGRVQHVLMTTDAVGGVWNYSLELAGRLSRHGIRTTLAGFGPSPKADQLAAAAAVPGLDYRHGVFGLEWMPSAWEELDRAGRWLEAIADEVKPDLLHHNGYALAARAWSVPVVVVAHSCVLSWWQAVRGEPAPDSWGNYRDRVREGVHAADVVIAPTRAMLSEVTRHYGHFVQGRVIPNGRTVATRRMSKQPFILGAGRLWDEAKNVAMLDAVAPSLPWPIAVAGPADGVASELANVRLLGSLGSSAMLAWMSMAGIFAAPARYEPFGLAVLEAAQAGCALVLSDIPTFRELWGRVAAFVPPGDAEGWISALTTLAEDDVRRERMGRAAAERAAMFGADKMAEAYLDLYEELAAKQVARREFELR